MQDINLGPYRINPRGEIQPTEQYKFFDMVSYKGSTYLNINHDIIDGVASIAQLPKEGQIQTKYYVLMASKGDKGDIADRYNSFITLDNNIWDYSAGDKVILPDNYNADIPIQISNVYDGCCGVIITNKNINLPENSDISVDFHFLSITNDTQYYMYTFIYNESINKFIWNRSVYTQ